MGETVVIELAKGYAESWLQRMRRTATANADHQPLFNAIDNALTQHAAIGRDALRATRYGATIELEVREMELLRELLQREQDKEMERSPFPLLDKLTAAIRATDIVSELERKVGFDG